MLIELLFVVSAAAADFSSFERSVTEQMKRQGIPGVAIAVRAPDGSLAYSKGFGVTSAEDPAAPAITPTTLFRLGSTAKLATAAAIRKAGLDLTKPIAHWAPDLPPPLGQLTLGQLLTHTSGMRDDAPMDGPHDDSALSENVHSWQPKDVLMAAPGEAFSYANPGYVLAGYVLQKATAKPFADAVRDLLGLQRSTYRPLLAMTYPLAQPHSNGGKVIRPFPDHAGAWPPGSLFSNAEEYSKLVWENAHELAAAVQVAEVKSMQAKYGLGVIETSTGALFHTGARLGYGSSFVCLQRTCAVVLTNLTSVTMRSFAEEAVRIAAGIPATPASAPGGVASAATGPVPVEIAAKLAGRFFNSKSIQAELRLRDGVLELRGPGSSQWIRVEQQAGAFLAKGAGPLSRFHITMDDATGKPKFLHAEAWALRYEAVGKQ